MSCIACFVFVLRRIFAVASSVLRAACCVQRTSTVSYVWCCVQRNYYCVLCLEYGWQVGVICVLGSLVGVALSPVMPLLFEAANMHTSASFWQVPDCSLLAAAAGLCTRLFTACCCCWAAVGLVCACSGTAGCSVTLVQCCLLMLRSFAVALCSCLCLLLAAAYHCVLPVYC